MPPLKRIHSDTALESGLGRLSLEFWRKQETSEIVRSLVPGEPLALKTKKDGRIYDGNTRIKVLEERGYDVDGLPREIVE